LKEWTTPDFRNTPSTTNLEKEEIMDAVENDGKVSIWEQINRPNPWRKMIMIMNNYVLKKCHLPVTNALSTANDVA
jgi:hypothetical protein